MKRIVLLISLVFFAAMMFSQEKEMEKVIEKNLIDCNDILNTSYFLIPEYHENNKNDSLFFLLNYWEENCYKTEALHWTKILLAIENDNFSEELYDEEILDLLINYKLNPNYYPEVSKKYMSFLKELSEDLSQQTDLTHLEFFFVNYFDDADKRSLSVLKEEEFDGSQIQKYYLEEIYKTEEYYTLGIMGGAGVWIPGGRLSKLGLHPSANVSAGYYSPEQTAMVDFKLAFINTPEDYEVIYEDSLFLTNRFVKFHFGLTYGKTLLGFSEKKISLLGGVGYDAISTLKLDNNCNCEDLYNYHYINSLNLNLGLGFQYYINEVMNLYLRARYNFLFFKNKGGSDLSGNALSINLGVLIKSYKYERYRYLELNDGYAKKW